ncbi:peptidyl-prolyl cis-trans isomerase [Planctomycetales bacterium]|nr:peptidyl-prolyl cis-trans isomerase [Planctomycetales bacterium]GHS96181.1 peptidyl-prolyl cis-trans isomerase [Planctomycetales bacterium]GHT04250.1 peptidyl-prolyl cis-trans isomerase [Planctomycetales bacterium]GHV19543.1 peptidyl-prolyl cis-trans isomerase [Planctomycetales bacterium]
MARFWQGLLLTAALAATPVLAGEATDALQTDAQKSGYAMGLLLSQQSQQMFGPVLKNVDLNALGQGVADGLNKSLHDGALKMDDAAIKAVLQKLNDQVQEEIKKEVETMQKQVAENAVVAEKFMAENKSKPGIKTTETGLQYLVVKEGDGATPQEGDTVSVHYVGKLTDGKEFDSSVARDEPFDFEYPGPVIEGWNEILGLMKAGGKVTAFLPPALAYGDRGAPPVIPPASVLVFDIELLKVTPKAAGEEAGK